MSETHKYYWLKLNKDFFNSKRIKKLRKLAGGDTHLASHIGGGVVNVSVQVEFNNDNRASLIAAGAHILYSFNGIDAGFKNIGDVVVHNGGAGSVH